MEPESHPATQSLDSITADVKNGVVPDVVADRLQNELRPLVLALAALDPREAKA